MWQDLTTLVDRIPTTILRCARRGAIGVLRLSSRCYHIFSTRHTMRLWILLWWDDISWSRDVLPFKMYIARSLWRDNASFALTALFFFPVSVVPRELHVYGSYTRFPACYVPLSSIETLEIGIRHQASDTMCWAVYDSRDHVDLNKYLIHRSSSSCFMVFLW